MVEQTQIQGTDIEDKNPTKFDDRKESIRDDVLATISPNRETSLITIWKSDIPLLGLKIMDVYLSEVEFCTGRSHVVTMKKTELEDRIGIDRLRTELLEKSLQQLCIPIQGEKKTIRLFQLAQWTMRRIELVGAPDLFRVCNRPMRNRLSYTLPILLTFTRRFTYVLYHYLEIHKPGEAWLVDLKEFREIIGCTDKIYETYKYFNDKVLKVAYSEICGGTDLQFTYDPVRQGRKIAQIRFTVIDSGPYQEKTALDAEEKKPLENENVNLPQDSTSV